jgi:DNA-binding protein H-NS
MATRNTEVSLPEITAQIEQLQRQAALLREKHKKPVIRAIVEAMGYYGISHQELRGDMRSRQTRNGKRGTGSDRPRGTKQGKRVAPKYRNPKTGDTWSGRGRPARWIADAEERGQSRERFLIK